MNSEFGILNLFLWPALLLVVVLMVLANRAARLKRNRASQLGRESVGLSLWSFLAVAAFTLITLAVLRPYYGSREVKMSDQGRDILAVVDVSNSMLAKDVSPDRISFVRRKLYDLVEVVQGDRTGDRIGLVLFAGDAYLYCPLTADYGVLKTFINAISPDMVGLGGSRLGRGLQVALDSLEQVHAQQPLVLVFTDGEDREASLTEIKARLERAQVAIAFFGVGTAAGQPIEVGGRYIRDQNGKIVITKLDEAALLQTANALGGKYQRAVVDDHDLRESISFGSRFLLGAESHEGEVRVYGEIGPWLIRGALLLILLAAIMGRLGATVPLAVLLTLSACTVYAQESPPELSLHEAWRAYEAGEYEAAARAFAEHAHENPDDLRAAEAHGDALYRLGKFDEAEAIFDSVAKAAKTAQRKFSSSYNRGNAELMRGAYDEAIASYRTALELRPEDEAARANMALAEKLKAERRPPPSSSSSQSSSNSSSDREDNSSNSSEGGSKSDSSTSASKSENSSADGSSQKSVTSGSSSSSSGNDSSSASSKSNTSGGASESSSATPSSSSISTSGSGSSSTSQSSTSEGSSQSSNTSETSNSSKSTSRQGGGSDESSDSSSSNLGGNSHSESDSHSSQGHEHNIPRGIANLPTHDPKALKELEAKAWLESLPDNPVLLQRQGARGTRQSTDTW